MLLLQYLFLEKIVGVNLGVCSKRKPSPLLSSPHQQVLQMWSCLLPVKCSEVEHSANTGMAGGLVQFFTILWWEDATLRMTDILIFFFLPELPFRAFIVF